MKPERNSPCPCGSGKKYKHCCAQREAQPAVPRAVDPALLARGVQALQRGDWAAALAAGKRLLADSPLNADALCLCGLAHKGLGDLPAAQAGMEKAVAQMPQRAEYRAALAEIMVMQGRYTEAAERACQALELNPQLAEAHAQLALASQGLGQLELCIAHFQTAAGLDPHNPQHALNLGTALQQAGKPDDAERCYRAVIERFPAFQPAHANLGALYVVQEQYAAAQQPLLKALELNPTDGRALTNLDHLLYAANYAPDITPDEIFILHRRWGEIVETQAGVRPRPPRRSSSGKPRLGYLSPDFCSHAAAYYMEPFLAHHDRERFEVYCYANVEKPDAFTERFRRYPHQWREVTGQTDEQVAEQIRADGIDILVDLAGHTKGNRLRVLALRPAPLQISYLGYPNTTGLSCVDYYLTDARADREGSDHLYTEKLVRLPDGLSCFRPEDQAPEIGPLPMLENGHVTFASLNVLKKFNDSVAALWSRVLEAVPGSRMIIQCRTLADPAVQQNVLQRFARHGIGPDRLELLPGMSLTDHLALYNRIDIALDPFPWNGHTTTSHALWMGVPVITLAGNTHPGRLAASVLGQVGLEELIARTPEECVARAVSLAADSGRLQSLRHGMRARMLQSRHGDEKLFTRTLEDQLLRLWSLSA